MKRPMFAKLSAIVATAGMALALAPLSASAQPAYCIDNDQGDYLQTFYVESLFEGEEIPEDAVVAEAPDDAVIGFVCQNCGEIIWFDQLVYDTLLESEEFYVDHFYGFTYNENGDVLGFAIGSENSYYIAAVEEGLNDIYLTGSFLESDVCTEELLEGAFTEGQLAKLAEDIEAFEDYAAPYYLDAAMTVIVDAENIACFDEAATVTLLSYDGIWSIDLDTNCALGENGEVLAVGLDLSDKPADEVQADGALTGGWAVNENAADEAIPEDALKAFDAAMEGLLGVGYTPVALLGTQVVAGTNYAFLCTGTTVTAQPKTDLYVVIVYQDLQGNAEITNISEFDIASFNK